MKVAIALGSNLDDPLHYLQSAKDRLLALPQCDQFIFSSIYKTVAVGHHNSPDYLNAVACLQTSLEPHSFLMKLQEIELAHQRVRAKYNEPRTLDLDLLLYNEKIIIDANLIIPHPRMHTRFFVLTPLNEIAPKLIHPVFNKSIDTLENELEQFQVKASLISKTSLSFA